MSFWVRDKGFYRNLACLAIPIVLQNYLTYSVTLADNLMVGQLGETAMLGLYFGSRVQLLLFILLVGMESAIVILASQYWGKKDCEHIKDILSMATRMGLVFSALLAAVVALLPCQVMSIMTSKVDVIESGAQYLRWCALSYVFYSVDMMLIAGMRAVEMVRIGLVNSIVALCVNCVGNYLLIFGKLGFPALGVKGAAVATVVSRCVEFLVVLYFVLKVDGHLKMRLVDFRRWNKVIFKDLVKYGLPLMCGQVVWAVNQFVRPIIIGAMSKEAGAALSACDVYDSFLCVGAFALAAAVGIIVGKTIGRGEIELVKTQAKTMQVVFLGYGLLCGLAAWLFKDVYLGFYVLSEETLAEAELMMCVLYVVVIGRCYQAPGLMGLVKAGGDTSFVFKNDTVFVFCAVLPSAILAQFVFHAPAWVVYGCLLCDQILKCFVAVVKINRFDWMKKLTRPAGAA